MGLVYPLFFLSGLSGLIYQVIWARAFGTAFGNTVYSSSLVIAIFMLGLGLGSYAAGVWADRRYARLPDSLLRAYGIVELLVATLAAVVSLLLPSLAALSAGVSAYVPDTRGWFVLSTMSYVARGGIAVALLAPITMLMGSTLTLLIRHRVRRHVESAPRPIATLYAVNTVGAAAGAFLTDFALVPTIGLFATQMVAVALNVGAGLGALWLAGRQARAVTGTRKNTNNTTSTESTKSGQPHEDLRDHRVFRDSTPFFVSLALALTGFSTLGIEIVWLRHITLLLGGFRAVFSLLLTVILIGIGVGALAGTAIARRTGRPALMLMVVQSLFVITALAGLVATDMASLAAAQQAVDAVLPALSARERWWTELWFNARPILIEAGLPSLVIGCSFPLANALVQRAEATVGRRAGLLYLANTTGAVLGSLTAGFVLLPLVGMQGAATVLMIAAAVAIVPLAIAGGGPEGPPLRTASAPTMLALAALGVWIAQPSDLLRRHAAAPQAAGEHLIATSEGINEVLSVAEIAGRGRGLITNGHAMSSTARLDQRYMRALAHVPLLSMTNPSSVLVIGFGVGNTTHAASLHPSVTRIDVADLSRNVLDHAGYFADANHDVLRDPRVHVFVNDGRLHLHMQPASTYDLITLEPPPIAQAGVAALYSREFYALARSRLKASGYLSQWLPAYQVPAETTLAMVRAFVDVFPHSVLLSGMQAELLLVGTSAPTIDIDPERIAAALDRSPAVRADAAAIDLGTPTEIVGTFVGSAETLTHATHDSPGVADDRPLQEYGVSSVVGTGLRGVPASLFDLTAVDRWCPRCLHGNDLAPTVAGLDTYLALLDEAYHAPIADVAAAASMRAAGSRRILGSAYLGTVVPDSPRANALIAEAEYDLGSQYLERRDYRQAAAHLLAAVQAKPDSAAAHNDLGVALASSGSLDQALEHFRRAVALEPQFTQARDNLAAALHSRNR